MEVDPKDSAELVRDSRLADLKVEARHEHLRGG
jgi:hypothetical protein